MQIQFDKLNRAKEPQLMICNPNNDQLAPIVRYEGLNTKPTAYDVSELSINVYKYIKDKTHITENDSFVIAECYKYIDVHRQIWVEDLGYFIITKAEETDDGIDPYFSITGTSCEIEINNKSLSLTSGTYQFYDEIKPLDTVMGKILSKIPAWKLGSLPTNIKTTYRTFDDITVDIYNFMIGDMAEAFGCVFNFDIQHRIINVVDANLEIQSTDILLDFSNVLDKIQINKASEDIVTALEVIGNNDLTIQDANPIGTDVIYNFDYYKYHDTDETHWMSENLTNAVNVWEQKITNSKTSHDAIVLQLENYYGEYGTLDGQLQTYTADLDDLNIQLAGLVSTASDTTSVLAQITSKKAQIDSVKTQITAKLAQIKTSSDSLTTLLNSLSFNTNFSQSQLTELNNFIFQSTYTDENIEITDSMSYAEKFAQAQLLYNKGLAKLNSICMPRTEFTIDSENFLFIKEFDQFRDQLELGKLIHVKLGEDNIADVILLQYELNYDNKSLALKLSNRMRLHDSLSKYKDLYNNVAASASTLSANKEIWSYPNKSGLNQSMVEYMNKSLDLTKQALVASSGQDPIFDNTGWHGRKKLDDGTYSPEQLWMTNNVIAFTDDAWNTIKTAFGKIVLPNGTTAYGLNGDCILANTIMGNKIYAGKISSINGKVYFDLDNNEACVTKIVSSESDVYARIGQEEPQYGTAYGLFVYNTAGKIGQISAMSNFAGTTYTDKSGMAVISTGDVTLMSNTGMDKTNSNQINMRRNADGSGEIWINRLLAGSTFETVFDAKLDGITLTKNYDTTQAWYNYAQLTFAQDSNNLVRQWGTDNYAGINFNQTDISIGRKFSSTNQTQIWMENGKIQLSTNSSIGLEVNTSGGKLLGTWTINNVAITSDRDKKCNIQSINDINALDKINSLNFYSYNLKKDDPTVRMATITGYEGVEQLIENEGIDLSRVNRGTPPQIEGTKVDIGIMYDEAPIEIQSNNNENKSIDLYSYISLCAKALQETNKEIKRLNSKINTLEKALLKK